MNSKYTISNPNQRNRTTQLKRHYDKRAELNLLKTTRKPRNIFIQQKNKTKPKKNITSLKSKNGEAKSEDQKILKIAKEYYTEVI